MPWLSPNKPATIDEYRQWLHDEHDITISRRTEVHYHAVVDRIKTEFEDSAFWQQFKENRKLRDFNEAYQLEHNNYPLTAQTPPPEVLKKPFDSFLLKTFRKNVLDNTLWPDPPNVGGTTAWVLPQNWFEKINDIVRTCFVVKYLDGVHYLAQKIEELSREHGMDCVTQMEAREEGYYAAHLSLRRTFEIPKIDFDTVFVPVVIEVQITSQLQEVIRLLLHKYYEERRQRIAPFDQKWQWNYKSDEFATNYLGHILHYLEGMIVEVRDKQSQVNL